MKGSHITRSMPGLPVIVKPQLLQMSGALDFAFLSIRVQSSTHEGRLCGFSLIALYVQLKTSNSCSDTIHTLAASVKTAATVLLDEYCRIKPSFSVFSDLRNDKTEQTLSHRSQAVAQSRELRRPSRSAFRQSDSIRLLSMRNGPAIFENRVLISFRDSMSDCSPSTLILSIVKVATNASARPSQSMVLAPQLRVALPATITSQETQLRCHQGRSRKQRKDKHTPISFLHISQRSLSLRMMLNSIVNNPNLHPRYDEILTQAPKNRRNFLLGPSLTSPGEKDILLQPYLKHCLTFSCDNF